MLDTLQGSGLSRSKSRGVGISSAQSIRLFLVVVVLCINGISSGQNYLTSTGTPAFAAPESAEYGFVDASNGNLHLELPIGSYPQSGSNRPATILFTYDANNLWTVMTTGGPAPYWNPAVFASWTVQHLYGTNTSAADRSQTN